MGSYHQLNQNLTRQAQGRDFFGALLISLLAHGLLAGLLVGVGALNDSAQRRFLLADATTTRPALRVSMKFPDFHRQKSSSGNPREISGSTAEHTSRFNSDVLQQNRREIYNSIVYPRMARKMGWQGQVQILVTVAADGSVINAAVASGSGYSVLDQAALRGVKAHRFTPGEKTESIVLNFRFRLKK